MHPKPLLQAAAALCLSVAAPYLTIAALAQTASPAATPTPPSSGVPLIVAGSPFTAQEWTSVTFTHADGTTSKMLHRGDLARNTTGSTRRELRILANSGTPPQPTGSVSVDIHDAANYLAIHMVPASNTATVYMLRKTKRPYTLPGLDSRGCCRRRAQPGSRLPHHRRIHRLRLPSQPRLPRRNQRPEPGCDPRPSTPGTALISKTVLLTETHDSLGNSTVTELRQIIQAEPDPTLFTVPQNYATTTVPLPGAGPQVEQ